MMQCARCQAENRPQAKSCEDVNIASRAHDRVVKKLLERAWVKSLLDGVVRRPNFRLCCQLRGSGLSVHRIGDCEKPGRTTEALAAAAALAYRL